MRVTFFSNKSRKKIVYIYKKAVSVQENKKQKQKKKHTKNCHSLEVY